MTFRAGRRLAFDVVGDGPPVVLLHGLTFDRRVWDPVVEHLGQSCRCVCVDLPAHGESGGSAASIEEVADAVADTVDHALSDPAVVVGHSMGAVVALRYAARRSVRGVVNVDQPLAVGPFVELVQALMSELEEGFEEVFARFTESMGFGELPPAAADVARSRHRPERDVVLGYWSDLVRKGPEGVQAEIDADIAAVAASGFPFLMVTGHRLDAQQRRVLEPLGGSLELQEWPGTGHFPHLAEPERFAAAVAAHAGADVPSGTIPGWAAPPSRGGSSRLR